MSSFNHEGSTQRPSFTPEGLASLDRAVRSDGSEDAHVPSAGTVGEFAHTYFSRGVHGACATFPAVSRHLGIDAPPLTDAYRRAVTRPDLTSGRSFDAIAPMAMPAFGAFRLDAPPMMMSSPVDEELPASLQTMVAEASQRCEMCAELVADVFQMLIDDGLAMHPSHEMPDGIGLAPESWRTGMDFSPAFAAPLMMAPLMMAPPMSLATTDRTYEIGRSRLRVHVGDLTESRADVMVSSDDDALSMGGGVSRALLRAANRTAYRREATRAIANERPRVGDVVVTGAPGLEARFVFHVVTLSLTRPATQPDLIADAVVRQAVATCLTQAQQLGCHSIAFPVLATGVAQVAYDASLTQMLAAIVAHLRDSREPLGVEVVLHQEGPWFTGEPLLPRFDEVLQRCDGFMLEERDELFVLRWPGDDDPDDVLPWELTPAGEVMSDARRRQSVIRSLRDLDARRLLLEREQIGLCVGKEPSDEARLLAVTDRLETLRERRRVLERALVGTPFARPQGIYLSSTYTDLRVYRTAVEDVFESTPFYVGGDQRQSTAPIVSREVLLTQIESAAAFMGVVGWRYGSRDQATGKSYPELEYEYAVAQGKPIFLFLAAEGVVAPGGDDADGAARIRQFRARVAARHDVRYFADVAELATQVQGALRQMGRP